MAEKSVKKVKVPKEKKPEKPAEAKPAAEKVPKQRKKKQVPTPEELKKILHENITQFTNIAGELESELVKLKPLGLVRTTELVESTLNDIKEDLNGAKEDLEDLNKQLTVIPEEPKKA